MKYLTMPLNNETDDDCMQEIIEIVQDEGEVIASKMVKDIYTEKEQKH